MEPIKKDKREAFHGGPEVSVANISDGGFSDVENFFEPLANEGGEMGFLSDAEVEENKMSDEDIKIKSLNQAINIAKLMSDVTVDDVLDIAAKVAKYIKG